MKRTKRFSRVLAILCSVVLMISSINIYAFATETTEDTNEVQVADGATLLGIDDFLGGASEKSWSGSEQEVITAGSGTLDGVTIDGIFNISRYSSIAIGSKSGYRLMLGVNNSSLFYYQFANANGIVTGGEAVTFDQNALGCYYNGQDVRIKVSFAFANYDESTGLADVTINLKIGDYLDEIPLCFNGVTMAEMGRNIFVNANTGAVTLKVAPEETKTVLGIDDFIGGATEKNWSGTNSELLTAGDGTLDNVTIDGIFNISRYSSIAIGSQAGYRLMIGVNNSSLFYYQFANASGIVTGGEAVTFDQNALGCYYNGQDVPIKVSFEFAKQNYVTGLAEVTIKLKIGDYLDEKVLNFSNVIMSQMGRNIFVYPNTGAVTLKVAPDDTPVLLGIDDFIGGESEKSWTGSNSELITAGDGTLDNVTIDGIFNISRYSSIAIGSQAGYRLMIGVNNSSLFYYQFANASGIVTGGEAVTFDQNALGCYYNGQDVRIKASFEFAKQNYVTGLADVTIKLKIGDYLDEKVLNFSNVIMSQMGRNIFVNPNTAAVTLKVTPEETTAFTALSVKDFMGADETTYSGSTGQLLTAGEGNLDRVVIDGTINLSRYASILIGSQAKNRLQIGVNNNYVLYYQYANASGVLVGPESFDTSYAGKDVKLNVSFVYSRKNTVANTADVTVQLNIGDSIEREFTVIGVPMNELQRAIYVNPNTGSLTMKANVDYCKAETGFAIDREGITVDDVSVTDTVLTTPGDYFVRSTLEDLFAKYVVVYKVGDAHMDSALDVRDIVATLKAASGEELTTKAAMKSADANENGTIGNSAEDDDCKTIRGLLVN